MPKQECLFGSKAILAYPGIRPLPSMALKCIVIMKGGNIHISASLFSYLGDVGWHIFSLISLASFDPKTLELASFLK